MRSRTPIAFASILVVALLSAGGLATFTATRGGSDPAPSTTAAQVQVSARVAAAILALSVARPAPETVTSTTAATTTTSTTEATSLLPSGSASPPPSTSTTTTPPTTAPADTTPPRLTVTSPDDGDIVGTELVTFEGTTEPGARVFSGPYEAEVDEDGRWSLALVVTPGPNGAVFTARDAAGNEATLRIVVHYEPPTTTTTTTTTPPHSHDETTTTTAPHDDGTTTTTAPPPAEEWSPQWPASPAGKRDVEEWRDLVAQYWDADKVDCALGLIYRESRGDPQAHNLRTDAVGLFQHLLKYWKPRAANAGFRDENGLYAHPYNAEANIAASAWLAAYYEGRGHDWWKPWGSPPSYGTCGS